MIHSEQRDSDHYHEEYPCERIEAVQLITRKDLQRRLLQAKSYIESNYCKENSVRQIAREVGISEFHFSRTFRTLFLISPYQYLLKLRMNHAEMLLRSGNFSVSQVAYSVGFTDLFSFSKFFKKHSGIAPSCLNKQIH